MASKLALIPQVPLRYDYPAFQELARRIEKRLDEIVLLGTEVASTSGTSIDFTGIPAWVTKITINFADVSTNGTSLVLIQMGDSGGIEVSGYLSGASIQANAGPNIYASSTAGFVVTGGANAASVLQGTVTLTLENSSTNTWIASGAGNDSGATASWHCGGSKSTSAALDRIRITAANGTDAFDAGAINIRLG